MLYLPEIYYFQAQSDFPLWQTVLITAKTVCHWCTYYYARIISPRNNYTGPLEKYGNLPENMAEREDFVADMISWLLDNSSVTELFYLLLDDEPTPKPGKVAKFDHHDDTCCWVLNLTETEFTCLQKMWKSNGLPEDLFYSENNNLCFPYPGTGLKARLFRVLGFQKCYTPKQWEKEKNRLTDIHRS